MSNRFHVNKYQVFGNHELFPETEKFMLETCHAKVDSDGCFGDTEVADLNGLIKAVALDTYDQMKEWATDDASVLLSKLNPKRLTEALLESTFTNFPDPRKHVEAVPLCFYWQIKWFLDDKRVATVYNLVNCLLNEGTVRIGEGGGRTPDRARQKDFCQIRIGNQFCILYSSPIRGLGCVPARQPSIIKTSGLIRLLRLVA